MRNNGAPMVILVGKDGPNTWSFWQDKIPCWHMCHCLINMRNNCPAFRYQHLPCWEIEGTYLKLSDDGSKGDDTSICRVCRVHERYGRNRPIDIKLRRKGIDVYCKSLKALCGVTG